MKELYYEMLARLRHLESLEDSLENKYRINELSLCIVRVQQILLENIKNK